MLRMKMDGTKILWQQEMLEFFNSKMIILVEQEHARESCGKKEREFVYGWAFARLFIYQGRHVIGQSGGGINYTGK